MSRMSRQALLPLLSSSLAVAALVAVTGCADFDRQDHIEDTRVLAVRTEPAEVKFSPLYSLLPPSDRPPFLQLPAPGPMTVEVFAYDPRGGLIRTSTQMCPPNAPDSSCLNNYEPEDFLQDFTDEQREVLDDLYVPHEQEQTVTDEMVVEDPAGRLRNVGFTFDFNSTVIDSIVQGDLPVFPIYPRVVVEAENLRPLPGKDPVETFDGAFKERAFKRIPVSMDFEDPSLPVELRTVLYDILGFPACEQSWDEVEIIDSDPSDCIYAFPANQNPELLGFDILDAEKQPVYDPDDPQTPVLTLDGPLDIGKKSVVSAARGTVLHLDPVFPTGVSEPYQAFGIDLETEAFTLQNRREDIVVTWYTTAGDVGPTQNTVLLNLTMGVDWTLPSANDDRFEAGDRITLIAVVRDQRGGVDVGEVVVELR